MTNICFVYIKIDNDYNNNKNSMKSAIVIKFMYVANIKLNVEGSILDQGEYNFRKMSINIFLK